MRKAWETWLQSPLHNHTQHIVWQRAVFGRGFNFWQPYSASYCKGCSKFLLPFEDQRGEAVFGRERNLAPEHLIQWHVYKTLRFYKSDYSRTLGKLQHPEQISGQIPKQSTGQNPDKKTIPKHQNQIKSESTSACSTRRGIMKSLATKGNVY